MHPFRRLAVWRKAHLLAISCYRVTEAVSHRRIPHIADQLCRAAFSVPTNIAEGTGRDSPEQFARFLEIAIASAREVDYLLLLSVELGAITTSDHAKLEARTDEVCRMLVALRATVRTRALPRAARSPLAKGASRKKASASPPR